MSLGGDCNVACRVDDRDDNLFDQFVGDGSKVVFVAAAGNGRPPDGQPNAPSVGSDVCADNSCIPCIEDYVICVGALQPGGTGPTTYSNFGGRVLLFAPTNAPVMAFPASFDGAGNALPQSAAFGAPVSPKVFTGTSASAPFMAGVVAMMKAVAPDLNHDAVAQILRDTAQPGTGVVARRIDAYAAVRRAAGASPIVKDVLENNDLPSNATNLGAGGPFTRNSLNIDARDRDHFRLVSPNGRTMTVALGSPAGLGAVSVDTLVSETGACGAPSRVTGGFKPLLGGGRSATPSTCLAGRCSSASAPPT